MAVDFEKQNSSVIDWANRTEAGIKGTANALGISHRSNSPSSGSSVNKIKNRIRMKNGIVEAVSFRFARSLVWPHKGAGKGMGGLLGSVWYDRLGIKHRTNPDSLGKMNTGTRKEKPFINQYLDGQQGVEQLADIVAIESGDAIVNNLLIK